MWQLILAVIIVLAALSFGIYKVVRYFRNPLRECEDCDLACSGCSLEELKKAMAEKRK